MTTYCILLIGLLGLFISATDSPHFFSTHHWHTLKFQLAKPTLPGVIPLQPPPALSNPDGHRTLSP